LFVSL